MLRKKEIINCYSNGIYFVCLLRKNNSRYSFVNPCVNWFFGALMILSLFQTIILNSQTNDTSSLFLNDVLIIEPKQKIIRASKKNITIDSVVLKMNSLNSLAQLLSSQSTVFIKSYGNGNIASSSIRGGNANHTAVLWNGLSIQNPMLGQTDLSLIQSTIFDNLSIEYGGGSAAWGSGAIGGSIHLKNNIQFNQGVKSNLQFGYGSYANKKIINSVIVSNARFYSSSRIYANTSKNNYTFLDASSNDKTKLETHHAEYSTKGMMQEFGYMFNQKNTLKFRFWYNETNRNLPTFTQQMSTKNQLDKNLRLSTDWELKRNKLYSVIKTAYFNDVINYTDSLASIFSESKVNTFILENDNQYQFKNNTIHFGSNFTQYKAFTQNYEAMHKLNKLAFFADYNVSFWKSKINYSLFLRKEFTNQNIIPITGNMGLNYIITKHFTAKINASKSYRQPSLNELYWKQGGNINLLPEKSKELNLGIEFKTTIKKINLTLEGNFFNRNTFNWIIWLPSEFNYWTPRNILEVYSRGAETKATCYYQKQNLRIKLDVNTSYVLSTNQKNMNENDNSKNKQMIYSPRYMGFSSILIQYKNVSLLYNYNYTGYSFTSTDNSSWLTPYQVSNVKISSEHHFKKMQMTLFGAFNNIFNQNYVVVLNNPMPLRNFEIGLTLQYIKKNKSKSN